VDKVLKMSDVVALIDAQEVPAIRGPHKKRPPKFQTETPPEAHIRAVAIGGLNLALYENRHRVTKLNAW
jgi:hypothetical protein